MAALIPVWDRRTGKKLPNPVPESYLRLFPYLARTPQSKARARTAATTTTTTAAVFAPIPVTQTPSSATDSPTPTSGTAAPENKES